MSNLSTLPKGDSAWLLRKAIERIIQQVSVLETNIGASTSGNSANTQIIFNDNGTLRGDAGLVYNKTTDALTVAGLVTAGSATITGAATVGTTLGVTGVSTLTGAVGVGATPIGKFDVYNTGSDTTVFIRSDTTRLGQIVFRDNADAGNQGLVRYDHANDRLSFTANGGENLYLLSTGDLSLITGNVVMATSGKGIDFSATANGSGTMTSELLNDYEEGTWTGTLKGSVSNPTVAVTATGKYTKVGRQVTVNISYNNVSTVGASGNVTIDGLPFNGPDNFAGSSIAFDLFAISTTLASWNAGTEIEFFITGAYVKATHNPGTGRYLTTTITYIV